MRLLAGLVAALALAPVIAGTLGVLAAAFGLVLPAEGEGGPFVHFAAFLEAPGVLRSTLLSAWTGVMATALSLLATLLILAASFGTRALRVAERLLAPILAVPHAAAALGLVFLFAPSGFVLRALSPWLTGFEVPPDVAILRDPLGLSLIAALVAKEVPFLFLMALAALSHVGADGRFAVARSLGYGRLAAFVLVVWPLIRRQLRLPVLAVLAFSISVVDIALILGPTRPPPLAVRIVEWSRSTDLADWAIASAGAVVLCALVLASIVVWEFWASAAGRLVRVLAVSGHRVGRDRLVRRVILASAAGAVGLAFVGFAGLVAQSFAGYWPFPDTLPRTLSLAAWQGSSDVLAIVRNTLVVALGASAIAMAMALVLLEAAREGRGVPKLIYAPLVVPQVAFLFGLDVGAIAAGFTPGIVAVTLAHAVFALPYVLIALSGPWLALDPRYEALASTLGVARWRRFIMVRVVLLTTPLLVAAALSVAVSVGLYLPTQLIGGGRIETVTTEAVAASLGADRRLVGVFASLQLLIPFVAFALARAIPAALWFDRRSMRPSAVAA